MFGVPGMHVLTVERTDAVLVLTVESDGDVGGPRRAGWSRSGTAGVDDEFRTPVLRCPGPAGVVGADLAVPRAGLSDRGVSPEV